METYELLNRIESIIEETRTAIFATTDSNGRAHLRWMTPALLKHRRNAIFAFSAPHTSKIEHIQTTNRVEWMVQTKSLTEIINIHGSARVLHNPALKAELMEILGPRLATFWHANVGCDEFVVIETLIDQATYFRPTQGVRETIEFTHPTQETAEETP